jgi:pimeloyl-ACP methyl ester carboxylesterase
LADRLRLAWEARLNTFSQFTTTIDGQRIHFLHVRSPEPQAVPLLLTHGWPGSVAGFLHIIGPLADPRAHGGDPADAFHVIAPALPGFGFSGPTRSTGWGFTRIARAWAELMRRLGYDRYIAQGGDMGGLISPWVGRVDPDRVLGVHVNALITLPAEDDWGADSGSDGAPGADDGDWQERSGYAQIQSTRPQTLAYALTDSPTGVLAWNLEWFVDYDPARTLQTAIDRDLILTNVTLYWLTRNLGLLGQALQGEHHAGMGTQGPIPGADRGRGIPRRWHEPEHRRTPAQPGALDRVRLRRPFRRATSLGAVDRRHPRVRPRPPLTSPRSALPRRCTTAGSARPAVVELACHPAGLPPSRTGPDRPITRQANTQGPVEGV